MPFSERARSTSRRSRPGVRSAAGTRITCAPAAPSFVAAAASASSDVTSHNGVSRAECTRRLLPGSRSGEIRRTLPMMQAVAERLHGHPRVTSLVLPTPASRAEAMRAAVATWSAPVEIVSTETAKREAFSTAVAAAAVSGTVTLELALAGVPMIATYVGDRVQAERFLKYKVKFVVLPNIVLDRLVVPELLFPQPEPKALADAVEDLLDDRAKAETQVADFAQLRAMMEDGLPDAPLTDPAARVLAWLGKKR